MITTVALARDFGATGERDRVEESKNKTHKRITLKPKLPL